MNDREALITAARELVSAAVDYRRQGHKHAADASNHLGSLLLHIACSDQNTDQEIVRHALGVAKYWRAL